MKTAIGSILLIVGLMVAAGSAGDCDGKCMEQANDLGTMLMVAGAGLAMMIVGTITLLSKITD
jgi:hypothetical protein